MRPVSVTPVEMVRSRKEEVSMPAMNMQISFLGAAQNVTGSSYLVEAKGFRLLVDCGMYQERKLKSRNWDPFPADPESIDAILLTHAHLDHCGLVPKLVRAGFKGKVYCTRATADIVEIVLLDSAKIQTEDVAYKKKRHKREGRKGPYPLEPLYTIEDAEASIQLLTGVDYEKEVVLAEGVVATFRNAGHILGSSSVKIVVTDGGEQRSILFSGDVGRWDLPILEDPESASQADYVVVESTYGNRLHKPTATIPDSLATIINETREAGGNVVIPSFAIERTQELLYHLNGLLSEKKIPPLLAFVDSPMAIRVTEVFRRHPELFDEEARALLERGDHPCDFPGLTLSRTVHQSKSINHIRGTALIIAGSGMCTGGRVKHHLVNNIGREESTVLFIGYQAVGTLGRIILEGVEKIRIHGKEHKVKARIEKINGFSAHADRNELLQWLSGITEPPKRVFVTHGEPESANGFASWLNGKTGWSCSVPSYRDCVTLD
jgi:metallo-beta-lactamase family protein